MRRLAALFVLMMIAATSAPITCAGWEASPQSRRECCKRAHHASCHDQTAADNCCAGHETGRLAALAGTAAAAHLQPPAALAPTVEAIFLEPPTTVLHASAVTRQLHRPPNLLVPLRI